MEDSPGREAGNLGQGGKNEGGPGPDVLLTRLDQGRLMMRVEPKL